MSYSDLQNLDKDVKTSCKKKNTIKSLRCNHPECKKKIDLIKFDCKCGLSFCMKHKNSYQHNCKYNYKNNILSLEKVVADKVIKI